MMDGEDARQCAKNTQRPEIRRIGANQEIAPVLNIGIATILDVLGIEVQVPSLSTPERFIWIFIRRGHERFVNEIVFCDPEIVNYSFSLRTKEEDFDNVGFESSKPAVVNHGQGSQDLNNVKTFWRASGNCCLHDAGNPGLLEKKQRRQQQSCANTSEDGVQLREDLQTGQNLDYNFWMPEMQRAFLWNSHLQVCPKYGSTPWSIWTRSRRNDALGCRTSSIERGIPKSTGKEFHKRGLAPSLLSWKLQDEVWNL